MNYGDVALGIESALPFATWPRRRHGRVRRLYVWLIAAFKRRA